MLGLGNFLQGKLRRLFSEFFGPFKRGFLFFCGKGFREAVARSLNFFGSLLRPRMGRSPRRFFRGTTPQKTNDLINATPDPLSEGFSFYLFGIVPLGVFFFGLWFGYFLSRFRGFCLRVKFGCRFAA